jgi:peroxiredoxin
MIMCKKICIVFTGILIISLLLITAGCAGSQELGINSPAPAFNLKDLSGQSVALSGFKGKTVFLHFWDTTFQPCVDEMPIFQQIHEEWSKDGRVVLVTVNASNSVEVIKTFMQSHNYTFKVLLDSQYGTAEKYNVQYVPVNFLIDPAGNLKLNVGGSFKTKEALEKQLQGYLP